MHFRLFLCDILCGSLVKHLIENYFCWHKIKERRGQDENFSAFVDLWGSFLMCEIRDFLQVEAVPRAGYSCTTAGRTRWHSVSDWIALGQSVWGEWLGFDIHILISVLKKSFPPLHIDRKEKMPTKLFFFWSALVFFSSESWKLTKLTSKLPVPVVAFIPCNCCWCCSNQYCQREKYFRVALSNY